MNNQLEKPDTSQKYVTMGFDGHPTIVVGDGNILPRSAELIIHSEYYPNWPQEKWPVDPETGRKLPMEEAGSFPEIEDHAMDAQRYYAYHGHFNHEPEGLGAVLWMFVIVLIVLIIIGIFYF